MLELKAIYVALLTAVKSYPNGVATVLSLAVITAARFGLHVTADELVAVTGAAAVFFGTFTHKVTVARTRLTEGTSVIPVKVKTLSVPDKEASE